MTAFETDHANDIKNHDYAHHFNRAYQTVNESNAYDNGFEEAEDYWRPKERERVIEAFAKAIGHQGKTHTLGSNCWFCKAVESIE